MVAEVASPLDRASQKARNGQMRMYASRTSWHQAPEVGGNWRLIAGVIGYASATQQLRNPNLDELADETAGCDGQKMSKGVHQW